MTTEEKKVDDTNPENNNENTPTIEELQEQISSLTAEASKQRKAKQTLATERDNLKKQLEKGSPSEDYKQLWQKEQEEKTRLMTGLKSSAIQSAVSSKLAKVGVLPDAIDAAARLVDQNMIVWDLDSGVEDVTVEAAVAKLKSSYGFMFEKKVPAGNPKMPADGGKQQEKTMTRQDFDKLSPSRQSEVARKGVRIV